MRIASAHRCTHALARDLEPLAAIVSLLRPRTVFAKVISGAGRWGVRYAEVETVGFGLVIEGDCHLSGDGLEPLRLSKGAFVLMPPTRGFTMSSAPDVVPVELDASIAESAREIRHGAAAGDADFRLLGGYFWFDPTNASLLRSLLPAPVCIHEANAGARRLISTIELLTDEALEQRPGRDLIVGRLVEVMLIEALRLRSLKGAVGPPGLLEGLADPNIARALQYFHADVPRRWTVEDLARAAGLSRSSFSSRFSQKVGVSPMEYVMQWRMATAKDILSRTDMSLDAVAAAIGYESASAFSTAFRREVGLPPSQFSRAVDGAARH